MENRIIEFHGLPGAGKSTLLAGLRERENLVLIGVSEFNFNGEWSFVQKIWRFSSIFKLGNLIFLRYILKLRGKRKHASVLSRQEDIINLVYLVYLYEMYKKYISTNQIVLSDEGIVQSLAVFLHDWEINIDAFEGLKKFLKKRIPYLTLVHCQITIEESLKRINQRNRKEAKMDFLNSIELQEFVSLLSLKQAQLRELFSDCYNSAEIDLSVTVEEATNSLEKVVLV